MKILLILLMKLQKRLKDMRRQLMQSILSCYLLSRILISILVHQVRWYILLNSFLEKAMNKSWFNQFRGVRLHILYG
ncbi:hypothetical protein C1X30_33815, partial [Pseudomonas sp. FW305-BF6]